MKECIKAQDGFNIYYQISGTKPTAIVFVHGWLGNADWWTKQTDFFKEDYCVVQIDLSGHGQSEKGRTNWSSTQYANDIKYVTDEIESNNIILVGHSMSGPYVLEASLFIKRAKLIVLVDTLKNMDKLMDYEQANNLLFKSYQQDFAHAVKHLLPKFLFVDTTPVDIREQLQTEFLQNDADFAVKSIEPLYKMNIRAIAKQVQVPVRAINSDATPTDIDSVRKYISNFDYYLISGCGHYPMLEKPNEFNFALQKILQKQSLE
jgi:sigma-B regulation protein RsbQ